ncbi:hypothetical protein ACLBXB_20745 [Methylobacterium mesophilicum]
MFDLSNGQDEIVVTDWCVEDHPKTDATTEKTEFVVVSKTVSEKRISKGFDTAAAGPPVRYWSMMGAGSSAAP